MRTPAQTIGLNLLVQQHLLSRPDNTLSMKAIKLPVKIFNEQPSFSQFFFFYNPLKQKNMKSPASFWWMWEMEMPWFASTADHISQRN